MEYPIFKQKNHFLKKVLVIDDELDIAEVITIALSSKFFVSVRHFVRDPVTEVISETPDIILLDLWIPEIGGERVIAALKTDERTKDIPIIIISADSAGPEIARRNQADGFMAKPFTVKALKALVSSKLA